MFHGMDGNGGTDWFWMAPMIVLWIVMLGGVVYGAVRLGLRHSQSPRPPVH